MTTITKPTRAKRRTFKDVAATAHAKGLDEGYAKAAQHYDQHYEHVQEELLAEIKALQARLGESIWSRLTGLFKGGRHDL